MPPTLQYLRKGFKSCLLAFVSKLLHKELCVTFVGLAKKALHYMMSFKVLPSCFLLVTLMCHVWIHVYNVHTYIHTYIVLIQHGLMPCVASQLGYQKIKLYIYMGKEPSGMH
jgi:hypothetical protein